MASLIKQGSRYYLQFYSAKRIPTKKRIPLLTRTKSTALSLQRKLEDKYATGAFDSWTHSENKEEDQKGLSADSSLSQKL